MELISKDTAIRVVDSGRNRQQLVDMMKAVPPVNAIQIDRIKKLREEMENNCRGVILNGTIDRAMKLDDALELIDNMIKEYSDGE